MADLTGVHLKLARAEHHLDALKADIDAFRESHPYRFFVQQYLDLRAFRLCAALDTPAPLSWACIVGDCAHNARCALEHLIGAITTLPPGDSQRGQTHFPIVEHQNAYAGEEQAKLLGVLTPHRTIIEGFQPYRRPGGISGDALYMLQKLNNTDKHRLLVVAAAVGRVINTDIICPSHFGFGYWDGTGIGATYSHDANVQLDGFRYVTLGAGEIPEGGADIAVLGLWGPVDVKMQPNCALEVKFGPGCRGVEGRPVVDTLTFILDRVKEIVGKFS